MAELHQLSRRLFLRELGRGTVAVAVLGPTVIACSGNSVDDAVTPSSTAPTATTTPSTTVAGGGPPVSTAGTGPQASTPDEEASATTADEETQVSEELQLRWERVSLGFVSAYVLARGNEVAIVDTGTQGSSDQIEQALVTLGANWDDVDHVILTHLHGDHVGGLGGILDAAPSAIAYAGEADVSGISSPRTVTAVNDGDEVFGLQVIGTPGHTAGHISVLDPTAGFLVAGDALNESNGMIVGPNPSFSSDVGEANRSVAKLATSDFHTAVFGHGEPFVGEASEAVVALARTL